MGMLCRPPAAHGAGGDGEHGWALVACHDITGTGLGHSSGCPELSRDVPAPRLAPLCPCEGTVRPPNAHREV